MLDRTTVAAQESNHAGFPEDHQGAVRTLLLCHHRLQSGGGRSQPAVGEDAVSSGHMFRRSTRLLQRVRPLCPLVPISSTPDEH